MLQALEIELSDSDDSDSFGSDVFKYELRNGCFVVHETRKERALFRSRLEEIGRNKDLFQREKKIRQELIIQQTLDEAAGAFLTPPSTQCSQETVELQSKYSKVIEEKKAFFQQLLDSTDGIASTQVRRNLTLEEQFLFLSSAMNEDNDTDEDDNTDEK
jgi:hypothetical protein